MRKQAAVELRSCHRHRSSGVEYSKSPPTTRYNIFLDLHSLRSQNKPTFIKKNAFLWRQYAGITPPSQVRPLHLSIGYRSLGNRKYANLFSFLFVGLDNSLSHLFWMLILGHSLPAKLTGRSQGERGLLGVDILGSTHRPENCQTVEREEN